MLRNRPMVFTLLPDKKIFDKYNLVRKGGLEPPHLSASEPKSGASTNSATFANQFIVTIIPFNSSNRSRIVRFRAD